MKVYRIKLISQTNVGLLIFSLLTIFFVLVATVIPFSVVLFVGAYFLWKKYVTGIAIWTLNEDSILIVWEKRFFRANTPDYTFKWSEINKIWRGMDPNYYNLKFKFGSGKTITFFHNGGNDDFDDLLIALFQMWDKKKSEGSTRISTK
jgi:hypothetical protein